MEANTDKSMKQELSKEAWCMVGEELELRLQSMPDKIWKLEKELGAISKDHKRRKIMRYEIANIGTGIGGGIGNTQELNVMKYNEAMDGNDSTKWVQQVAKEHSRMLKDKVWRPRLREAGRAFKTIISTWAMKKRQTATREPG